MVSTNALTIKAKLVMQRATNPTPVPIPRDENSMNAHTRAGIFLKNVAKPLTIFANLGKGDTFSLPKSDTKNASIAAMVVADIASARVTSTLESTPGILLDLGSAGGKSPLL